MIVKVQLSLMTTEKKQQVLIYDETRSIQWSGDATRDVQHLLGDEPKAYCYARLRGTKIVLDGIAPDQDW